MPELWNIDIGSVQSTCADSWMVGGDNLQILFSDTNSIPKAGRTYTIVSQASVSIYPADGEATAVYSPANGSTQGAASGWVRLDAVTVTGQYSGAYEITLKSNSTIIGVFRSDQCPFEAGDCD